MQLSYAAIFRTHVWDDGVRDMAERARACCASGKFVVATDETKGPLPVETFDTLPHSDDFSEYGLPNIPVDKVLWWNADYVLYAARRALPDHDYYIMLEYDVHLNCDLDRIISQCYQNKVDFVAHGIRRMWLHEHWSSESASEMGDELWWAFIPLVIVSARAIDEMLQIRQHLAAKLAAGQISHWPYCEPFLPTAVAQRPELTSWRLDRLVDSTLLAWRPFISTRDPRLSKAEIVAHPVLSGQRLIKTFIAEPPSGSYYMTDGRLREELKYEDFDDLQAVFGDQIQNQRHPDGSWLVAESIVPREPEIVRPWIDLAYGKAATQSIHSRRSHGASAEEDAAFANRDPLPDDFAFHTDTEEDPWWQVDLLEICVVERIEIINRVLVPLRFTHFHIDASRDGENWTTCFSKHDNAMISSDPNYPARFTLGHPIHARYIRIMQLGADWLHLRSVRVLGFPLDSSAPGTPEPMNSRTFAGLLTEPEIRETLAATVESIVHQRVLGRGSDSYDIDKLALLSAGVDSSLYAVAHMANARRFPNAMSLLDYAAACTPASGMVLEFGAGSGTSINHIANQMQGRQVYGFDSFEGLPEDWRPGFPRGAFRSSAPTVIDNVALIVGWFDQTLPAFVADKDAEPVALLHVDCELYSSTRTIFHLLGDRIRPGTIIVFDEYFNYPEWRAQEFRAFQEFVAAHGVSYEYIGLVPTHQQVAVRILTMG